MTRDVALDWAAARSERWRRQLVGLEAMLQPIDEPLLAALDLAAPARIVDVGCGSGATTIAAWQRASAGSVAHGFDLSPALIEVARRRSRAHEGAVAFEVADMGTTPPPGPLYDRMVSRLGVMFFADPLAAFAALRRWLVPGGRIAYTVWGPIEDNPWMAATRDAVAAVTGPVPVEPLAPGPFRYAEVAGLVRLLENAGFIEVSAREWRQALSIGDRLAAPGAARFALAAFSSFADRLSKAGGDAHGRACLALTERFTPFEVRGAVLMPAHVHIVTGRAGEASAEGES